MSTRPQVRARLLGGLALDLPDGSSAGPWQRPAARRLVAYLLLSPTRQAGREQLAEALFANLDPARASNAVSKALTMARSALHEDQPGVPALLAADRAVIRFRPDITLVVDVDELRAAVTSALRQDPGQARADALRDVLRADFTVLPEEAYADWALPVRDELQRLHSEALVEFARACPPAEQVQAWTAVAAVEPSNEQACAALVQLYLDSGQRDRAVRTFHRCRAALLDDLGVEPSSDLTRLITDGLRSSHRSPPALPERRPQSPPGRTELLDRILRQAERPDRSRALAIAGPAGIGKTTVGNALAEHLAARGWLARQVTAAPDDRLAPYAGVRLLLPDLLDPPSRRRFALLAAVVEGAAPDPTLEAQVMRARLAEELVGWLDRAAATRPVVLVFDDAHWMDEAQRALLSRAARGAPGRWLLVIIARSDEPAAVAPDLPLDAPRFLIPPLTAQATRELVRAEAPAAAASRVEEMVSRSVGNPFFAAELARQWHLGEDDGRQLPVPERIIELLHARITRCSGPARQLLPLVALAGNEATYELVVRAGSRSDMTGSAERCIRALDELTHAHLLVESPDGLRLLHPLLRDAALATVNPIRRGALHGLLADALAELGTDPRDVARHRLSAFTSARLAALAPAAAEAGFQAARLARQVFANDAASELLHGGLDAWSALPRTEADRLRAQAVWAWITIGDIHLDGDADTAAADAMRVAIALAESDQQLARAWSALGSVPYRKGDLLAAAAAYESGMAALRSDDPLPRAGLLSDLGWLRHREGRNDEALALLEQARPVLELSDETEIAIRCLDRLAVVRSMFDPPAALATADEALAMVRNAGSADEESVVLLHRAQILGRCDRVGEALMDLEVAEQHFLARRDRYMQSVALWARADLLDQRGDPTGAVAALDAEIALLEQVGNARNRADAHIQRIRLLSVLGRRSEAEQAYASALAAARESGDPLLLLRVEAGGPDGVETEPARGRRGKSSGTAAP